MSIQEKENRVFDEWKNSLDLESKRFFIPDGVVDEESWNSAPLKILFLLKEVNGGEAWDERQYLYDYNIKEEYLKTHSLTINTVLQWAYGAMYIARDISWEEVAHTINCITTQTGLLRNIALVNIKKLSGAGNVDYQNFDKYFNDVKNTDYLRKQLAIYKPDIIICGGTGYYFQQLYKDSVLPIEKWKKTHRGTSYCIVGNTIVIDYCHPQARIAANIKYYALIDAIAEIKQLMMECS
ncbi:hypothetical protein [Phascolarctobacterium sp.]